MTNRAPFRPGPVRALAQSALLAVAMVVAGCTAYDPAIVKAAEATISTVDLHDAPRSQVSAGGQLTLAVDSLPANFNPVHVDGAVSSAQQILAPTRGSAVRFTGDGGWIVDPNYAKSVRRIEVDPLTIRVDLNPRAVWQGGKPITSADMVSFVKAIRDDDRAASASSVYADIDEVKQRGVFSYDVVFKRPNNEWPLAIYPEVGRAVTDSDKAFNTRYRKRPVPSNGPFRVASIDTDTGTITLERNPRWWGAEPKLETIVWRVASSKLQGEAWAADELDAIVVTDDNRSRVDADDIRVARGNFWTQLTINGAAKPFNDVRVRRAISLAIDRQAFADLVTEETGYPAAAMSGVLRVPGQVDHFDDVPARDVDRAKELLAEVAADGGPKNIKASLPYPGGRPAVKSRAELAAKQLGDVGITVDLREVELNDYFNDVVFPLDFDLTSFMWEAHALPVTSLAPLFTPKDSSQNFTGVEDDDVTDGFAAAPRALNSDEAIKREARLERAIELEASIIPLAAGPEVWGVNPAVVNYGPATFQTIDWTRVGFRSPP